MTPSTPQDQGFSRAIDSRLTISPKTEIYVSDLKSTLPDGSVVQAYLEFVDRNIQLSQQHFHIFIGTTAGKKGLPNQDFAGLAQKDITIADRKWSTILALVADGVSSRKNSEDTSKSVVENTVDKFSKITSNYSNIEELSGDLWHWIADGAQHSPSLLGVTTLSLFLLAVSEQDTTGIAINCGDSRVYWATPKYVESAKVHVDVTSPTGSITYSLGADRKNDSIKKDVYLINEPIQEVFLCTDTFAYQHDGVHFPSNLIPSFGRALSSLNDHLTAISIKRITT